MGEEAAIRGEVLAELLMASLDTLAEGVAVLNGESRVVFWNEAAVAISGYQKAELISRPCPPRLYQMAPENETGARGAWESGPATDRPVGVLLRHSQGHTLPAMLRRFPLRDSLGKRFGTLLRFHPAEDMDALQHGESGEGVGVERGQAEMEDRLDTAYREWSMGSVPFGLVWVTVDQAALLRKTHGRDACEAMLGIVEVTLLHGLRPTEILGRWGDNEFLLLFHERTAEMLTAHAQRLAGLARTADFRWWGDRVSLTVSIGAAQAVQNETLACLVARVREGMQASVYAGGNRISHLTPGQKDGRKGQACSQL